MFSAYANTNISQKNKEERNQDLIYSIWEYDMAAMMQAIEQGADLDTSDTLSDTNKLMEPPLFEAIDAGNLPALKTLLKRGAKTTATSTEDVPAFTKAVSRGNFEMVQEMLLHQANPNIYHGCTALQAAIVDLPSLAIIRYSDWSDSNIKAKLLAWYHQQGEFAVSESGSEGVPFPEPVTQLRASYKGMLEIIALLLKEGVKPWIANDDNVNVLDILADPVTYKKYFAGSDATFQESADKDRLTFKIKLANRNNSSPILEVVVDYNLKEVKNRIETYMKFSAVHGGVDIKTLSEDFQYKIADHVKDAHTKTTMQMEQRVQTVEAAASQLQVDTLSIVQKNKIALEWQARKEKLDAHKFTRLFCERVDSRLRSCISATISLASDTGAYKIQRQKGTAENILSQTLSMIGEQLGPFGGIVFSIVGKAVEFGIDKYYDGLYKQVADLFTFTNPQDVCDKVAIATAEMCAHLNTHPLTTERDVERLADTTVAFLVYLMSSQQVVKLGTQSPIETQLIDIFARSEFLSKCGTALERKDHKELEKQQSLQQTTLEKQRKEGEQAKKTHGSKLLAAFKSSPVQAPPPQQQQQVSKSWFKRGLIPAASTT